MYVHFFWVGRPQPNSIFEFGITNPIITKNSLMKKEHLFEMSNVNIDHWQNLKTYPKCKFKSK